MDAPGLRVTTGAPTAPRPRRGVLVLLSHRHAAHPYADWLAELGDVPLLGVATEGRAVAPGFAEVARVASWEADAIVDAALRLHDRRPFDRVIGLGEVDILAAGRLRDALGIVGQDARSSEAYRDKLVMRAVAARGGVRVPPFARADGPDDVVAFLERHPGPAMVKRRFGVGAAGLRRVDTADEARALAFAGGPGLHLVERYVAGRTFHVDGLCVGGALALAVPCAYTGAGCLAHLADAGSGSVTLAGDDPLFDRLVAATEAVYDAFPGPPDLALHAEFFHTPDDEIVLVEVASRHGGAQIPPLLARRVGRDLRGLWVQVQCGLPVDWAALAADLRAAPLVGGFTLPLRRGRVRALPAAAPPGVEELSLRAAVGEDFAGRYGERLSGDWIARWIVTARGGDELLARLDASAEAMERAIAWDLAPAG